MDLIIITIAGIILAQTSYLTYVAGLHGVSKKESPVFIDSSVLIDGRILDIVSSGFIKGKLYIPKSVINELQYLADHGDADKRQRARYGLDIAIKIQEVEGSSAEVFYDDVSTRQEVDERLLFLAKKYRGSVCTVDFNLNKVASVQGIKVLNINDLAMALRPRYLPGERTSIKLTQKGQDSRQAVGHLDDGTMVVVDNASKFINQVVEVELTRSLQSSAGKLNFAKLVSKPADEPVKSPVVETTKVVTKAPVREKTQTAQPNKKRNQSRHKNRKNGDSDLINLINKQ
jgi:uncharacterized protein YacL